MFTALNGFANTFWEWRLVSPETPGAAAFAQDAETYARWALEVAKERRSTEDFIVANATLGNVLLAQARPLEAIHYLKEAHTKVQKTAPRHARWNEVRWSLAQAYLCAGENDIVMKSGARAGAQGGGGAADRRERDVVRARAAGLGTDDHDVWNYTCACGIPKRSWTVCRKFRSTCSRPKYPALTEALCSGWALAPC